VASTATRGQIVRSAGRAAAAGLGAVAFATLAGCGAAPTGVATRDEGPPPEERVELVPSPSTAVDESTTTTSPTTTSTTTAAAYPAPEAPTALHLEGKHDALEHFEFGNPRCPVLAHDLAGTMTMSDGAVWQFTETYCGILEPGPTWVGHGTFVLTAPDGSTLTGTFGNSAPLPTKGVPYRLDIDTGTGTYAGATGTCAVDNHLDQPEFGKQYQFGTFTCDVTLA
jgi:hypothetical protein